MLFETNYKYIESDTDSPRSIILTTGMLGSIDKSKSLKPIVEYFRGKSYNVLMFDMFAHGKTEGNIEDYTLSLVYKQIEEMISLLEDKGKETSILYGVSASSLPILKYGLDNNIEKIILRSPAVEMYAKRNRELGLEKMIEWKKKGIIKLWNSRYTQESIYFKYKFIKDLLNNFHCLNLDNNKTKILLGSGKEDIEVPFFELQALEKRFNNISLKGYSGEGHSLSESAIENFINDIDSFLK